MKRYKSIDFVASVMFVGILITFMLYLGLGIFLTNEDAAAESSYPVKHYAADDFRIYNALFYNDARIQNFVTTYNYKFFRHVSNPDIIVGNGRWLFATKEEGLEYNYLLDYIGEETFEEEKAKRVLDMLKLKKEYLSDRNAEFMLIVVPNSMSVYEEFLPSYLGTKSENSRLAKLDSYLENGGFGNFYNLTDLLKNKNVPGISLSSNFYFNNTENSLTALGTYKIYEKIMSLTNEYISTEGKVLTKQDIQFTARFTEGRKYAKTTGIENIINNVTISFAVDLQRYSLTKKDGQNPLISVLAGQQNVITVADADYLGNVITDAEIILEYSTEWDKVQLIPLLSNTFGKVTYKYGYLYDSTLFEENNHKIVIQIIHENELEILLDPLIAKSYK